MTAHERLLATLTVLLLLLAAGLILDPLFEALGREFGPIWRVP